MKYWKLKIGECVLCRDNDNVGTVRKYVLYIYVYIYVSKIK